MFAGHQEVLHNSLNPDLVPPEVVDSEWRDGRVVDGARLESDFGKQLQATPKHFVAQRPSGICGFNMRVEVSQ